MYCFIADGTSKVTMKQYLILKFTLLYILHYVDLFCQVYVRNAPKGTALAMPSDSYSYLILTSNHSLISGDI